MQSFLLIPIDHGLSFPDTFNTCEYEMVWMDWPQVKEPFSIQTLEYISKIDPIHDIKLLTSKISFRKECLQTFCLAEIFLKKAAQKGLTLYEIGNKKKEIFLQLQVYYFNYFIKYFSNIFPKYYFNFLYDFLLRKNNIQGR